MIPVRSDHRKSALRRRAFTLLEMLVVITILSMLMAILLPSLNRARQQAHDTRCLNRVRSLYVAHLTYLQDNDRFPSLNNDEDDGAWQYNYLIFDGRDFDHNFGPLINDGATLDDIEVLFCPVQKDLYHSPGMLENPWPTIPTLDTRSGYARRYHLSGKSLSQIKRTIALFADVFHLPRVIKNAHKNGVNAAYSDGHGAWVHDPGDFAHNELSHPFDPLDNTIVRHLWHIIDKAGQ